MSRKITFLTLFLWLMTVTFPVIAQQKADTTYTFRFVPQKDMFYVPWNGNDTELARLLECIENNKATILDGKLPLLVDGYCNSQSSEVKNLATAKIRANRVKSELITHGWHGSSPWQDSRLHRPANCSIRQPVAATCRQELLLCCFQYIPTGGQVQCHCHSKERRTCPSAERSGRCRSCLFSAAQ